MSDSSDLWNAAQLIQAFRAKTLSPVEVTRSVLARIEALNPALNAYYRLDAHGALEAETRDVVRHPVMR